MSSNLLYPQQIMHPCHVPDMNNNLCSTKNFLFVPVNGFVSFLYDHRISVPFN